MNPRARQGDEPAGFERPVAMYILIRLLLGLALLALTFEAVVDSPGTVVRFRIEFTLAAVLFGTMGVSAALLRTHGARSWFPWSQVVVDAFFATALVLLTDGPVSPYFPLYFMNIVAAAWLLPPSGPVVVAAIDAAAFGGILVFRGTGWLRAVLGGDLLLMYTQILVQVFAFFLVGMLSGMLAGKVRTARRELAWQVSETHALQERHEAVLDQLDSGVLLTDVDGRIRSVNPAAERIFGTVTGQPVADLLQVGGARWEQEFRRGDAALTLLCARSTLAGGGEVVLVEDITRLRAMERAVVREERLGAVGRLAAGLAHEIRNPLASLSGSVQLLRDENPSPLYGIVLREVKRLNELVEDFLEAARPVSVAVSPADPGELIGDVVTAFRNDPRYQGRRVVATQAQGLPLVPLDPARFRQVLWNLLLNAAQATADFGNIEVSAEVEGDWLSVRVSDDGVGIASEALARIFDPFYTTRSGGTGLGLANVDRIVRAHGGAVSVDSEPGQGSRFVLRFPLGGGGGSGGR